MQEHHFRVPRTARFVTLGPLDRPARDVWFALHGYGQLAPRFARRFAPLDDGERLIVVPEGLSRYYVDHKARLVGASWMTREDRLAEIADYVEYLDRVLDTVLAAGATPAETPTTVLGFSQGTHTACRWLAEGHVHAARAILWGAGLPIDLDFGTGALQETEVVFVRGEADAHQSKDQVDADAETLAKHGIRHRAVTHPGGHEIDPDVLRALGGD